MRIVKRVATTKEGKLTMKDHGLVRGALLDKSICKRGVVERHLHSTVLEDRTPTAV